MKAGPKKQGHQALWLKPLQNRIEQVNLALYARANNSCASHMCGKNRHIVCGAKLLFKNDLFENFFANRRNIFSLNDSANLLGTKHDTVQIPFRFNLLCLISTIPEASDKTQVCPQTPIPSGYTDRVVFRILGRTFLLTIRQSCAWCLQKPCRFGRTGVFFLSN
jgi:hypothetical protein